MPREPHNLAVRYFNYAKNTHCSTACNASYEYNLLDAGDNGLIHVRLIYCSKKQLF